jgi:hypothetical protein
VGKIDRQATLKKNILAPENDGIGQARGAAQKIG